jgi:serine/threonine protein kinase
MGMIRAGQRFGDWVTVGDAHLGGGGNGEVWRVQAADGRTGAIKVLTKRGGREGLYRLGRFRDEIGFLLAHPEFPGVLPMLDSHISEDLSEPSWYVMPVAIPIREALGSDPEPRTVVAAMAEIADTLHALAAEGVGHRDIKPDNLFSLDSRAVIGDFGLVTYPVKDPRTEHGRKLGPTDYMAPEMRRDADSAAPGPADVWALAKTLWVLLTDQELPLPGTHNPHEPAHALRDRITFAFAPELDLLLEKATQVEPGSRITMGDMARELHACLSEPPEVRPSASLDELHARAAALTATSRQNLAETQDRRARYTGCWDILRAIVADTASELADLLTFEARMQENGYQADTLLERASFMPYEADSSGWLLMPSGQPWPVVEVVVAGSMRAMRENDPMDVAALLTVNKIIDRRMHDGKHSALRLRFG